MQFDMFKLACTRMREREEHQMDQEDSRAIAWENVAKVRGEEDGIGCKNSQRDLA